MLLAVPFQSSQLPFSSSWRSVGLVPIHAVGVRNEGFFRPNVLGGIYAQIALLLLVHLGNLSSIHGCATAATTRGIHAKIVVLKCTIVAIVVVIIVIVLITEISVGGGHDDTNAKIGLLSILGLFCVFGWRWKSIYASSKPDCRLSFDRWQSTSKFCAEAMCLCESWRTSRNEKKKPAGLGWRWRNHAATCILNPARVSSNDDSTSRSQSYDVGVNCWFHRFLNW